MKQFLEEAVERAKEKDYGNSTIWSHSACERTGIPATFSKRSKKWICPVHKSSKCVTTFKNEDLLDRLADKDRIDAEHPRWPTKEEIAKHKKFLKKSIIYHDIVFWIQEPLTLEQWITLDDRLEAAFGKIKHMGTAGPIPASE